MVRQGIFSSENINDMLKNAEKYAQENNFKLNPNKTIIENILKGLLKKKKEKGEFYCPCRILKQDKKQDEEIICPCVFHKDEIAKDGHCTCLLFVK